MEMEQRIGAIKCAYQFSPHTFSLPVFSSVIIVLMLPFFTFNAHSSILVYIYVYGHFAFTLNIAIALNLQFEIERKDGKKVERGNLKRLQPAFDLARQVAPSTCRARCTCPVDFNQTKTISRVSQQIE